MNLYEHEGKALLRRHGIRTPEGVLLSRGSGIDTPVTNLGAAACLAKAQVLAGKRAERGGVVICEDPVTARKTAASWFADGFDGSPVESVLIEARVPAARELYVSCLYDELARGPILMLSLRGGSGVETRGDVKRYALDPRTPGASVAAVAAELSAVSPALPDFCASLVSAFFEEDARQIEINPLAESDEGELIALDAKIALDDQAAFRHPERLQASGDGPFARPVTERERAAREIDAGEGGHRGTAGTYLELDGDVAVLFSGGGASLANMDAMRRAGLKAANYTEYSGNPPKEKVHALARLVLSKPGLRGALIVGGIANFTDVKETFAGIAEALDEIRPAYPIVVRRAGPREREGMELLRECAGRNGLRMELFGKETTMEDAVARMKTLYEHPV